VNISGVVTASSPVVFAAVAGGSEITFTADSTLQRSSSGVGSTGALQCGGGRWLVRPRSTLALGDEGLLVKSGCVESSDKPLVVTCLTATACRVSCAPFAAARYS
jgi:hypothetical protein